MLISAQSKGTATVADLLAIPEEERFHEIMEGELIRKANPAAEHGDAQSWLTAVLKPPFARRGDANHPGGWWLMTEVEVELDDNHIYRPDVVGWRRERVAERPTGSPTQVRPDWICEVLSESNARNDTIKKMRIYHRYEIPHYWIVDPRGETLSVYRWMQDGYLVVLVAEREERVRAEPFDAIELQVGVLFGDDQED